MSNIRQEERGYSDLLVSAVPERKSPAEEMARLGDALQNATHIPRALVGTARGDGKPEKSLGRQSAVVLP